MSGARELDKVLKGIYGNALLDVDRGILKIQDSRIVMLFAEVLATTQKRMEALIGVDAAAVLLYESYKEAGKAACQIERKILGANKTGTRETVYSGLDFGRMLFWGDWKMTSFEKLATTFTARNSPVAEFYGPSERAVCHPIRGILAGFAETLVGKKRDCIEVRCRAKGDEYCRFVVATKENLTKVALEGSEKR